MAPYTQTAFRLPDDMIEALHTVKQRDGIPLAEQVRRALSAWLVERGIEAPPAKKTARGRVAPRK